ncbi:MAG: hypothetical protein WC379_07715 [Methanoregula sp.]|jgi:hypothetical protein
MNEKYLYPVYALAIIFALFTAGCVAPPQENSTFNPLLSGDQNKSVQLTKTQSSFVSEVTLSDDALTSTIPIPAGYTTFLPTTRIPEDITCRIHAIDISGYNGTAFTFNLKNPPMYINYSVTPKNVTVNKVYTDSYTKKTVTKTFSDYSPTSWFEITVRDSATKEIVLQDGFGDSKGYQAYLTRTLKVMKTGDLLVEFRGNDLKKASATIWVKPIGNFEESRLSEFTNCMYWEGSRDSIATAKPTTIKGAIYTWTPENKIKG